jgi:hypothetical protein
MVTLRATIIHPAPSMGLVVGTALAALVLATGFWAVARYTLTLAHEGGHAVAATALGARVETLLIKPNGEGETGVAVPSKSAHVLVLLSGYTGPSVFGIAGAILLNTGHVRGMLWLSLFFVGAALFISQTWFTAGIILATGGVVYLIASKGSPGLQEFFGYTWIWFLLIAGLRRVLQLAPIKWNAKGPGGDSQLLQEATKMPTQLFVGCFGIFNFAALIVGALILARAVG